MLDLNYVRENLEGVRAALEKRGAPTAALEDFAQVDAERRRVIAESDQLNAERNGDAWPVHVGLMRGYAVRSIEATELTRQKRQDHHYG